MSHIQDQRPKNGRFFTRALLFLLLGLSCTGAGFAQNIVFNLDLDYDTLGRLRQITHPTTAKNQIYTHKDLGAHDSVSYDGATIVTGTTYNDGGAATRVDLANHGSMTSANIQRGYDVLNRLNSILVRFNSATQYNAHSFSYNDWGFLNELRRNDPASSRTFSYGYGSRGELTSMAISGNGTVTYTHDSKGNLTARGELDTAEYFLPGLSSISYTSKNQRSSWQYDADGKLLADDRLDYVYNDIEQMESAVDPGTGWDLTHFLYDGTGERVREVVDDRVVYSVRMGGMLISQEIHQTRLDGGMDITHKDFVYHNGQVILTVTTHPDTTVTRQYQYRDRMGHPALVVDEEDGFAPRWNEYSPFGFEMRGELTGITTHEFTGHERDEATGLDYMHARYYDRQFARFNRPDPAYDFRTGNPFSYNLYAYTASNPVNYWDPNGQILDTILDIGSLIVDTGRVVYHSLYTGDIQKAKSARNDVFIDVGAMFVPFVPASAAKLRHLDKADDVVDAAKGLDAGADAAKNSDVITDNARLLPKPKTIKHHIFNKFRGSSPRSQKYRDFFKKHDISVDDFTVEIPESMHKKFIHRAGNNWTTRWKQWIDANPNATTKEVYQFGGKLMDEYGLSNVPLVPYR